MRYMWTAAGKAVILAACLAVGLVNMGCQSPLTRAEVCACPIPREKTKVSLETYTVEPPDILIVDAIRVVPKPPYRIQPLDLLIIQATGVLVESPIGGLYPVDPDGTVNLGLDYGIVRVIGLTLKEVTKEVEEHLKQNKGFKDPKAVVALA